MLSAHDVARELRERLPHAGGVKVHKLAYYCQGWHVAWTGERVTIGLYKTELIDHDRTRTWTGRADVEGETAAWVHWFSTTRIHHSIGKMSPIEFEEHYRLANTANIDEVA